VSEQKEEEEEEEIEARTRIAAGRRSLMQIDRL